MGSEMDSFIPSKLEELMASLNSVLFGETVRILREGDHMVTSRRKGVIDYRHDLFEAITRKLIEGDHIVTSRKKGVIEYDHHGIYAGDGKVIHFQGPRKNRDDLCKCDICGYQQPMEGKVVQSCIRCFAHGEQVRKLEYRVPIAWENLNGDTSKSLIPGKAIRAYKSNKFYLRMYKDGELYGHVQISKRVSAKYGIDDEVYCYEHASAKSHIPVIETAQKLLRDGFAKYNLVFRNCEDFATYCTTGISRSTQVEKWVPPYKPLKSLHRHFQMVEKKRELLMSVA